LFFTQAKLLANLYSARATNSYEKRHFSSLTTSA
jgi:hypothetical protein